MGDEIDLVKGRGYYAFIEKADAMYQFVGQRNCNVELAAADRSEHPLARMGTDELKKSFGLMHAILRQLWSSGRRRVKLIDIGAYIGDFSLDLCAFARDCGETLPAVLFEPGATRNLVSRNIAFNRLQGCEVRAEAVAAAAGFSSFVMPDGHHNSSYISASAETYGEAAEVTEVHIVDVADVVRRYRGEDFTILKIDTEGSDLPILQRLLSECRQLDEMAIVFEYSPIHFHLEERRKILTDLLQHFSVRNVGAAGYATNSSPIDPNKLDDFLNLTFEENYRYTDLLAVPLNFNI